MRLLNIILLLTISYRTNWYPFLLILLLSLQFFLKQLYFLLLLLFLVILLRLTTWIINIEGVSLIRNRYQLKILVIIIIILCFGWNPFQLLWNPLLLMIDWVFIIHILHFRSIYLISWILGWFSDWAVTHLWGENSIWIWLVIPLVFIISFGMELLCFNLFIFFHEE